MPGTIACIGTGPSLTSGQIDIARSKGFTLFGCNNAFQLAPDLALLYATNAEWWFYYWDMVKGLPAHKVTANLETAQQYEIGYIEERMGYGLSDDKAYIHHGHGSGFTLVNLAYHCDPDRILLLGYDLRYADDYDGKSHRIGSTPRHFFGEYPESMQHWPSHQVKNGVHVELRQFYRDVAEQGLVEIINCTPGSAIDAFEYQPIENVI